MRVGQRSGGCDGQSVRCQSGFRAMKGSIVSRQIDRSAYYNVLLHVTHRARQQMRVERYLLEHPVNFSDLSRAKGREGRRGTLEGYRTPDSFFFASPPAKSPPRSIQDPDLHPPEFFSPSEK